MAFSIFVFVYLITRGKELAWSSGLGKHTASRSAKEAAHTLSSKHRQTAKCGILYKLRSDDECLLIAEIQHMYTLAR